ncbi:MAG: hypothetical protein COA94_00375 [Rickettsiales bacterium]|nr:MAG: hypothetical protein COA94_00375 [Rickettsiales bacterium]
MTQRYFSNMTSKVLVASPFAMRGTMFHESVIYVLEHRPEGAIGFIVNKPIINATPLSEVVKKLDLDIDADNLKLAPHVGGPMTEKGGFFLHSSEYTKNIVSTHAGSGLSVSSSDVLLRDIAKGVGPEYALFVLGYTFWEEGEMELEFENNLWIATEANRELIFSPDSGLKWGKTFQNLGISSGGFAPMMANC